MNSKKCACVHLDALECSRLRYGSVDGFDQNDIGNACECLCHKWEEDDDEPNKKAKNDRCRRD